jgi:aminopeptidase N
MAYPTAELERVTDGSHCRYATTDDVVMTAEQVSGRTLDWFFNLYVRQPKLPRLVSEMKGRELHVRWDIPEGERFPMPVEVQLGRNVVRVEMPNGRGSVRVPSGIAPVIDPKK